MPQGVGYPKKKLKTNSKKKGKKMNFASQMSKVNKIMSKK